MTFTDKGEAAADRLTEAMAEFADAKVYHAHKKKDRHGLHKFVKDSFAKGRDLVFIGACGIAVRLIAPYIKDKTSDPAVIVMDEKCIHVIPILSGHLGGANELGIRTRPTMAKDVSPISSRKSPPPRSRRMACAGWSRKRPTSSARRAGSALGL